MTVKSFNLDNDLAEFIETRENQSKFVNNLLRRVKDGYDPEAVIVDYRIEEEKSRLVEAEARVSAIEEKIAELESRRERFRQRDMRVVREFCEKASETVEISPESEPVQQWADEADMDPVEFVQLVREERQ